MISVDPERARSAPRRRVQVGDRQFGVSGCGGDIFLYAPCRVMPIREAWDTSFFRGWRDRMSALLKVG